MIGRGRLRRRWQDKEEKDKRAMLQMYEAI